MAAISLSGDELELKDALDACSSAFESGDLAMSDKAVAAVIGILESLIDPPASDAEKTPPPSAAAAEEALVELYRYLSSPHNQMAMDALSLELPRVLIKFASLSDALSKTVGTIIDWLVSVCSPRDMIAALCEAIDTQIEVSKEPITYIPFLNGLSKVFLGIQRHPVKQVKEAIPIIIRVLSEVSSEFSGETNVSLHDIFGAAVTIGIAIEAVCQKLVERSNAELRVILGLYVLENIALITKSRKAHLVSSYDSVVTNFSRFLPLSGLSYLGLITGDDAATITSKASKEYGDDFMASFSLVMDGASLAVIWGYISDEVAKAAGEQLTTVLDKIRNNQSKRWQAVGMLRYALASVDYPWEIKSHCIELLLSMMDANHSEDSNDYNIDVFSFVPSLFVTLQAIQRVMIGASDASLRKKAFDALRKVISDLPCSERFDILKAIITDSTNPSMIAILIDLVKEEILKEKGERSLLRNDETMRLENRMTISRFWSSEVLDLVDLVLKPPKGGPPSLPEHTEPVLSALNLYRFILIIESTGKSNYTGVLSEKALRKAYSEWLLPLRTLVSRMQAENKEDDSELAEHIACILNPVEPVLYHCIELVEENLKHAM